MLLQQVIHSLGLHTLASSSTREPLKFVTHAMTTDKEGTRLRCAKPVGDSAFGDVTTTSWAPVVSIKGCRVNAQRCVLIPLTMWSFAGVFGRQSSCSALGRRPNIPGHRVRHTQNIDPNATSQRLSLNEGTGTGSVQCFLDGTSSGRDSEFTGVVCRILTTKCRVALDTFLAAELRTVRATAQTSAAARKAKPPLVRMQVTADVAARIVITGLQAAHSRSLGLKGGDTQKTRTRKIAAYCVGTKAPATAVEDGISFGEVMGRTSNVC